MGYVFDFCLGESRNDGVNVMLKDESGWRSF